MQYHNLLLIIQLLEVIMWFVRNELDTKSLQDKIILVVLTILLVNQRFIIFHEFLHKNILLALVSCIVLVLYSFLYFSESFKDNQISLLLIMLFNYLNVRGLLQDKIKQIFIQVPILIMFLQYLFQLIQSSNYFLGESCLIIAISGYLMKFEEIVPVLKTPQYTNRQRNSIIKSVSSIDKREKGKLLELNQSRIRKIVTDDWMKDLIQEPQGGRKSQCLETDNLLMFYKNIFNMFPHALLLINSKLEIAYKNQKSKRIFDNASNSDIILYIREALENPQFTNQSKQNRDLEQIIKEAKESNEDVLQQLFKNLHDHNQFATTSYLQAPLMLNRQLSEEQYIQKIQLYYTYQPKNRIRGFKLLKIEIIANSFQSTLNDIDKSFNQELIDFSSQQLLIIVKNISNKDKIKQLKSEISFQNSLLKSFSHELRTPLNGSIELLNSARQKFPYEKLIEDSYILNKLLVFQINDILDYAALQIGNINFNIQEFLISEFFDEMVQIYQNVCKQKQIRFKYKNELVTDGIKLKSDRLRLQQVLVNFLNNSLKFTQAHGQIELRIQSQMEFIKFSVQDNGVGIDWERLKTLPNNTQFQGIGLNIASRIIYGLTNTNQWLQVKSSPQNGTKISFKLSSYESLVSQTYITQDLQSSKQVTNSKNHLPIVAKQLKKRPFAGGSSQSSNMILDVLSEGKVSQPPKSMFSSYKKQCDCHNVLIVDDIPFNLQALQNMLKHNNILKVDKAYDGLQALQNVKNKQNQHCPNYKLVLMDIEMPIMNGFQSTKEILKITKVTIVMCSAYDLPENTDMAFQSGMVDFITKPVQKQDMKRILDKYYY